MEHREPENEFADWVALKRMHELIGYTDEIYSILRHWPSPAARRMLPTIRAQLMRVLLLADEFPRRSTCDEHIIHGIPPLLAKDWLRFLRHWPEWRNLDSADREQRCQTMVTTMADWYVRALNHVVRDPDPFTYGLLEMLELALASLWPKAPDDESPGSPEGTSPRSEI